MLSAVWHIWLLSGKEVWECMSVHWRVLFSQFIFIWVNSSDWIVLLAHSRWLFIHVIFTSSSFNQLLTKFLNPTKAYWVNCTYSLFGKTYLTVWLCLPTHSEPITDCGQTCFHSMTGCNTKERNRHHSIGYCSYRDFTDMEMQPFKRKSGLQYMPLFR